MPEASASRGKAVVKRVGCAACHSIPGIDWPKGKAAPALDGFAHRAMIAGRVPNTPELLARFVRNAPAVDATTTMPPMPMTEQESRDVAAFLYELDGG